MTFINHILIPFILGILIYTLIDYLIFKYNETSVFTSNISTEKITFTKDYQELLCNELVDNADYFIIYKNTRFYILHSHWTVVEIAAWIGSLKDQDYAVSINIIPKKLDGVIMNKPITVGDEFIVNSLSNPILISNYLINQLNNFSGYDFKDGYYIILSYSILKATQ